MLWPFFGLSCIFYIRPMVIVIFNKNIGVSLVKTAGNGKLWTYFETNIFTLPKKKTKLSSKLLKVQHIRASSTFTWYSFAHWLSRLVQEIPIGERLSADSAAGTEEGFLDRLANLKLINSRLFYTVTAVGSNVLFVQKNAQFIAECWNPKLPALCHFSWTRPWIHFSTFWTITCHVATLFRPLPYSVSQCCLLLFYFCFFFLCYP